MKKLITAVRRAPKRFGSLMAVAAALAVPVVLFAWGPDRPTYTMEKPAPHVTFNSITNHPTHGDERNFVQIKEASAPNSTYGEEVTLQAGKEYEVYVFYHNNAATFLNTEEYDYQGIARDAFMRVQMPARVAAGEKARITGFVGASNSSPAQVWDEAYAAADEAFALRIVPGSAKVTSNGAVNGATMPNSLFTDGAPLGYDKLDGNLPGCGEFSGYVTFRFVADQPNFEVTKEVREAGSGDWTDSLTAKAGSDVEYRIHYRNSGTIQQDNVVVRDVLPEGVTYVPGSTQLANSKTGGEWETVSDNIVTRNGINIGSYAPNGGNAYLRFRATLPNADALECGKNSLVNTAQVITENGTRSDTATTVVTVECEEPTKPEKPEQPEQPEVPSELPQTGTGALLLGLGTLTAGATYYVVYRRLN